MVLQNAVTSLGLSTADVIQYNATTNFGRDRMPKVCVLDCSGIEQRNCAVQ